MSRVEANYFRDLRWWVRDIKDNLWARLTIPERNFEQNRQSWREFMGAFCSFLRENPSTILAPIYPDRYQLSLVYLFLKGVEAGNVVEQKPYFSFRRDDTPRSHVNFKATTREPGIPVKLESNVYLRWAIRRSQPEHISINGDLSLAAWCGEISLEHEAVFPEDIEFAIFPFKVERPEQAREVNPWDFASTRKDDKEITIMEEGKRIIIVTRYNSEGEQVTLTESYSLLGHFEDERQQSYWVYGNNKRYDQSIKVPLRTPVGQMVTNASISS